MRPRRSRSQHPLRAPHRVPTRFTGMPGCSGDSATGHSRALTRACLRASCCSRTGALLLGTLSLSPDTGFPHPPLPAYAAAPPPPDKWSRDVPCLGPGRTGKHSLPFDLGTRCIFSLPIELAALPKVLNIRLEILVQFKLQQEIPPRFSRVDASPKYPL
jgi:hypothetical protein